MARGQPPARTGQSGGDGPPRSARGGASSNDCGEARRGGPRSGPAPSAPRTPARAPRPNRRPTPRGSPHRARRQPPARRTDPGAGRTGRPDRRGGGRGNRAARGRRADREIARKGHFIREVRGSVPEGPGVASHAAERSLGRAHRCRLLAPVPPESDRSPREERDGRSTCTRLARVRPVARARRRRVPQPLWVAEVAQLRARCHDAHGGRAVPGAWGPASPRGGGRPSGG